MTLPVYNGAAAINPDLLTVIIESVEKWLIEHKRTYTPRNKAELIRFLYMKLQSEPLDIASEKMLEYIEIYDELKKAN